MAVYHPNRWPVAEADDAPWDDDDTEWERRYGRPALRRHPYREDVESAAEDSEDDGLDDERP